MTESRPRGGGWRSAIAEFAGKAPLRQAVDRTIRANEAIAAVTDSLLRANPALARELGRSAPLDATMPLDRVGESVDLDAIPSETSAAERRLLFSFFSGIWGGRGDVVEVGPYLGGTTRAIAAGMLVNPRRETASRLHTYDRFADYHESSHLLAHLEPLIEHGLLPSTALAKVSGSTDFEAIFRQIHGSTSYADLIEIHPDPLPDRPEESNESWFNLSDLEGVEAFFVDGCKSWYATKHFAREAAEAAAPGAWFLFQDFGWYTCFWIPALIDAFEDAFALRVYVDATYVFQLRRAITPAEVDARFPDSPDAIDVEGIFGRMRAAADARHDTRATIIHELQEAAARAYRGEIETARDLIGKTRRQHAQSGFRELIEHAAEAPTYRPGGESVRLR